MLSALLRVLILSSVSFAPRTAAPKFRTAFTYETESNLRIGSELRQLGHVQAKPTWIMHASIT